MTNGGALSLMVGAMVGGLLIGTSVRKSPETMDGAICIQVQCPAFLGEGKCKEIAAAIREAAEKAVAR